MQDGVPLDEYLSKLKDGKEYIKEYVTTTDQQSQSVQGLINASKEARATQIAQNETIKQSTLAAKAGKAAMQGLAMAGNMIAMWAIGEAISFVTTAVDNYVHRVENANAAMDEAVSEYESARSGLADINTELEEQNCQMDALLAKDNLTYAEKGQLAELKEITRELQLQKDIEERKVDKASKEAAQKSVDAYDVAYGKHDISATDLEEKIDYMNQTGRFPLAEDEYDVNGNITAYMRASELLAESQERYNIAKQNGEDTKWLKDDIQYYTDMAAGYREALDFNLSDLEEKRLALKDEYNKAIQKKAEGTAPLTSSEKEIISSYQNIANAIDSVYKYTDTDAWNSMQISNILGTEGVEKSKEELIAMAKAGKLTPETLESYTMLNQTAKDASADLKDELAALAQTKFSKPCAELC